MSQKQTKIVYVSGQISNLDIHIALTNFDCACKYVLLDYGADRVVNPFNVKPFVGIKKWLFFMIADVLEQRKCTHSAFQSNWINSRGAVIEYFFAKFIFKHEIIFLPI